MSSSPLLIEIGVLVAGELDAVDRKSLQVAVDQTTNHLQKLFIDAGIAIRFYRVDRREMLLGVRAEPSWLLRQGQEERDLKHWDFVMVITAAELLGKYSSSSCFAALSRPLDAAVLSTSLIDPQAMGEDTGEADRVDRISWRLSRLMLHAIGHLSGLKQVGDTNNLMYRPSGASDLDKMTSIEESQRLHQQTALLEIADPRLEEHRTAAISRWRFFSQAAWINRKEIAEAVWAARPWQFPRRLSGLTIASVSTLLVLQMTAEAWDLALSQNGQSITVLTLMIVIATTIFVTVRQQLVVGRKRFRSEQNVVTTLSALLIVGVGMTTTLVTLMILGMAIASLLFSSSLIASWAASSELSGAEVGFEARLMMSSFCSALGLLIGALGASFESQDYFQHVIFVDEEM